ncbi:MAG: TraR/DksA family transcriptional regulator [Spirochaetales bacterium]|nr:TraR/DksA family transcriptional regulator [Spirochaetales bacterium]
MDKEFLKKMQEELQRQKEEILHHLVVESEGFRAIVEDIDPKDLVDMASDDIDKKNLEALNAVESKKLQMIDNALARIQNDRYGVCMECQKPIPVSRLQAIPYALFCIDCQSRKDRQNR